MKKIKHKKFVQVHALQKEFRTIKIFVILFIFGHVTF